MGINTIHHNDPNDPLFGQVTTIITADPPIVAKVLSKTEFADHCYAQLGGGITGIDRFGAILKAAAASTNNGVYAALDRYKSANTIQKDNTSTFIALLQSDGILTQQEADNVINNWPVQ